MIAHFKEKPYLTIEGNEEIITVMIRYIAVKEGEEDWNLGRLYNLEPKILIQTKVKNTRMISLKEMKEE